MDENRVAFRGTLSQLVAKVEKGELVPRLQASHAPPCKFWTAFQVVNGIRHVAPVIHGPKGCTYSVGANYKMRGCEYRGVPLEPTSCTAQDEADVVYGGEGKLASVLVGAIFMGTLSNGLTQWNVSSYYQSIIKGAVLVTAVLVDTAVRRRGTGNR